MKWKDWLALAVVFMSGIVFAATLDHYSAGNPDWEPSFGRGNFVMVAIGVLYPIAHFWDRLTHKEG